jgi:1,4-alpha-glucan branching enzyme
MAAGYLALVLHAHLPYVRHPEHRYFLEENWLYEAITATYLPLLEVWQGLARDGVPFKVTMSISPPLVSMLRDDVLKLRYAGYLDRLQQLASDEKRRTAGLADPTFHRLAWWYAERFARLKSIYDAIQGDVIGAYRRLQDDGLLEIITVGATHGYLPVIRQPEARRAQIEVACESYRHHFGRHPRGIWLPECGYTEGVDELLAKAGLRYFFTDAHGVMNARPRPPLGLHAPIFTSSGVAAFGRDLESSKQVWSANEGYPGDGAYRDFYRDIGFDLPLADVGPYIHPDGIRIHTGFKYFRVTGANVDLARKEPYDPDAAREKAAMHAGNFMHNREKQIEHLAAQMDRKPLVISPYDAELFGHWWFEGPMFLDFLCRKIAYDQRNVELSTAADYLQMYPINAACEPSPSSWGDGGYSAVWVDGTNDWIYRHVHRAETRMHELAASHRDGTDELRRRALNQAGRELLLAQSSDWAFIMKTATAVRYACDRVKAHLARFRRLDREISAGWIDERWLADVESRDNIFPELDYRKWL